MQDIRRKTMFVVAIIVWIAVGLLVVVAAYFAAQSNRQATFILTGSVKFKVAGKSILEILANVPGYGVNSKGKIVKKTARGVRHVGWLQRWIREKWGFYWVSVWYPWRRIHRFKIAAPNKLKEIQKGGPNMSVRDRLEAQKPRETDYLLWQVNHPTLVTRLILGDGTRMDALVMTTLELVDPVQAVFTHAGKFYPTTDTAVEGATFDLGQKSATYDDFIKLPKGPAADEQLVKLVAAINENALEDYGGRTVLEVTGYRVVDAYFVDYEPSPEDEEVAKEKRNVHVSQLRLKTARNDAKASAAAFRAPVEELIAAGVDKNLAAQVVGTREKYAQIRQSHLVTVVESGAAGTMVSVPVGTAPASAPPPTPAPTPAPTPTS